MPRDEDDDPEGPAVDLLAEIVRTLQIVGSSYYRADLNRPFGIAMPARTDHLRIHFVLRGEMWLELPTRETPVRVEAGSVFLLLSGASHRLVDSPGGRTVAWEDLTPSGRRSANTAYSASSVPQKRLITR